MSGPKARLRKALRGRLRTFCRRAPAASGFLVTGAVIGIAASGFWDLPERLWLLGEGLFGPAGQELDLVASGDPVTPLSLPEFGGLQGEPARPSGLTVSGSRPGVPAGALPKVAAPATAAVPTAGPPPDSADLNSVGLGSDELGSAGRAAELLLREIASRRGDEGGEGPRTGTVVQVASYTDARSADALAVRLQRKGFDSFVAASEGDAGPRFRVRVQPGGETRGSVLAQQLRELGFSVWVTRQ